MFFRKLKIHSWRMIWMKGMEYQMAVMVPRTDSLNQLWMITIHARKMPASNTEDI